MVILLPSNWRASWCAVLLVATVSLVRANDDLLDPSKIGKGSRTSGSGDLLSPTRPATQTSPSSDPSSPGATGEYSASQARGKAAEIVSNLEGLISSAGNLGAEIEKLERLIRDLLAKRMKLIRDKAVEMEEYRAGLFCSGCDKTKTQILAMGESFPHPGQSIIRPTEEQIAAKDRALQAPIDRTDQELKEARAKRDDLQKKREEAEQQIAHGFKLWRTAVSYEGVLNYRYERKQEAEYRSARSATEAQITKLRAGIEKGTAEYRSRDEERRKALIKLQAELGRIDSEYQSTKEARERHRRALETASPAEATDPNLRQVREVRLAALEATLVRSESEYQEARAALERQRASLQPEHLKSALESLHRELNQEIKQWTERQEKLDAARKESVRAHQYTLGNSAVAVGRERDRLTNSLNRGKLMTQHLSLVAVANANFGVFSGAVGGFEELGGLYRMGDYTPSRHNEVLPSVKRFVDAYTSSPLHEHAGAAGRQAPPPTQDDSLIPSVKGKLRDLLETAPDAEKTEPPSKRDGGGGIRG